MEKTIPEAYIRVVPDLVGDKAHIVLQTNITESGMGQRSNLAKMAADIMNVPYDRIEITPPETKINPTGLDFAEAVEPLPMVMPSAMHVKMQERNCLNWRSHIWK